MTKVERYIYYFIGGIIWVYLGLRSAYVPLIHDEAVTYYTYIRDATFIPGWCYWDANNHILNSALSALFTNIFGNSSFVIRMASWLSFAPLVYILGQFANIITSKTRRWMLVLPLITAPYFIELYGLTRGYGLSITLLLCTLLLTFRYTQMPSKQKAIWISIFGFLSSLASLSVIVTVMIIYGWLWLFQVAKNKDQIVKITTRWLYTFIIPLLPLVYYVFLLKERGLLYYGGDNFTFDTLGLLARLLLTSRSLSWVWFIPFVWIIVVYGIRLVKNNLNSLLVPFNIFAFTLTLSLVAIFAQHFLLAVNYPSDRAAIHLFVLLILSLVFLPIDSGNKIWTASLGILVFFPIHLILSLNTTHSKFWIYEYVPQSFVEEVQSGSENDFPPSVNAYFLRSYIWDYQQLDKGYYPSTIHRHVHPDEWADYVLVDSNRIKKFNTLRFDTVQYDGISGQYLLKQKIPNQEFFIRDTILRNVIVKDLYTNIFDFQCTELTGKPLAMYYTLDVKSSTPIMHTLIVTTIFDTNGVEVLSNKYMFNQVSENWTDKKDWKVKLYLPDLHPSAGRFVTYIYNPELETHHFPKIECKLAEISQGYKN